MYAEPSSVIEKPVIVLVFQIYNGKIFQHLMETRSMAFSSLQEVLHLNNEGSALGIVYQIVIHNWIGWLGSSVYSMDMNGFQRLINLLGPSTLLKSPSDQPPAYQPTLPGWYRLPGKFPYKPQNIRILFLHYNAVNFSILYNLVSFLIVVDNISHFALLKPAVDIFLITFYFIFHYLFRLEILPDFSKAACPGCVKMPPRQVPLQLPQRLFQLLFPSVCFPGHVSFLHFLNSLHNDLSIFSSISSVGS